MMPVLIVIIQVTSQGSAARPVMFAFGILGRKLAIEPEHAVPVATPIAA